MRIVLLLFLLQCSTAFCQELSIRLIEPKTDASFRGMSVVDNNIAWVSGSKGWIGKTLDGGNEWTFHQVPGFEKFDFRSIYAFNDKKVIIANAGAPANILFTADGGANWKTVYTNTDTSAFIDGIDFFNAKEGIVYGDPIGGKMLLIKTIDGGFTWNELPPASRPELNKGEASFAASGTNIRCINNNDVIIATGGMTSRLWLSKNKGNTWSPIGAPIIQGESATGIFSFAYKDPALLVIVGGNYLKDTLKTDHVFLSANFGKIWTAPLEPTRGYRECVEFLSKNVLVATGPGGTDVSLDGGKNWKPVSDEKYFHVVRKARKGDLVLIAGGKGKIGVVQNAIVK